MIDIWSIVLAEMCSEVVGSNMITFPWVLPVMHELALAQHGVSP